jgi:5-methylcytosine-specific restriction endonuclease McrA
MRTVEEWIGRNDDAKIPDRVKERIAMRASDCCQQCKRPIGGRLRAEFDHVIPLIIGGQHREGNLRLVCNECHKAKTRLDVKLKSKVARVRKRKLGFRKPRSIRAWRKFDGTPVYAERER